MMKQALLFLLFSVSISSWANSPTDLYDVSNWDFDAINASRMEYEDNFKDAPSTPLYVISFLADHLIIFDNKRREMALLKVGELAGDPIISADGMYAFVVLKNGWVKKYDLKTEQIKAKIKVGLDVANAALSGDGRVLLVGNKQPADLVFLNTDNLQVERIIPVKTYKGVMSPVATVRNTGDEHGFIMVAKDFIKLWKISYLNPPPIGFGDGWNHDYRCLKEHVDKPLFPVKRLKIRQKINNFYVNEDATFLVGKSESGKGMIMDLDLSRVIQRPAFLDIHPNLLWTQGISNRLASISEDKSQLLIYSNEKNPRKWQVIKTIVVEQASAIASCPNSDVIWIAESNGSVKLVDKKSLEVSASSIKLSKPITAMSCSKDEKYLFLGTANEAGVFDIGAQEVVSQLRY